MEKQLNGRAASPSTLTTYVQVDANSFRDLVQKLTGFASNTDKKLPAVTLPAAGRTLASKPDHPGPRRRVRSLKLKERRQQHTMRKVEIKLGLTTLLRKYSQTQARCLGLEPSPIPSPVTPLELGSESLFYYSTSSPPPPPPPPPHHHHHHVVTVSEEEEKAIAEKGFYLHPSPLSTPRSGINQTPELLTLFPLTSPKPD